MVLSGIRPSFPSLSRSAGQITHVLLTRSPLEHPHQKSGGLSVRLACVKHAASVRPEPGSNSPKKQTKKLTGKKQRNQQNNNKQQTLLMLMFAFVFMFMYKQSLLHQMTHYRVLKQHHHPQPKTKRRAANSDHTNIQTPPQNHKPPRHNNKISLLLITRRT